MEHKTWNMEHTENFHHAYVVEGEVRGELLKMLERSWKVVTRGNPDFSYQKFETLTVEGARALKEFQGKKAFAPNGKKIFVIEASSITTEAQNSLLKMFEEPTANTHFFLMGASVKNLIPTLASRFSHMSLDKTVSETDRSGASEFLKSPVPKRLALVKKLVDDIKDEKRTRTDALSLLQQIEATLYQKAQSGGEFSGKLFEDLEMCRDYLSDRSASVKMLLEYVALSVPQEKN